MASPDNRQIYNDQWAAWTDQKKHGPASRWLRTLVTDVLQAELQHAPPVSILDVGCGEGTFTHHIARLFPSSSVHGIDFSEAGIALAQTTWQEPNVTFSRGELGKDWSSQCTMVMATEVLEHIDDWQTFLQLLVNHAQTYLLLTFPTGRMREFETEVGHYRNYQHGQVEQVLHAMHFTPVDVRYAGFPFYSPLYRELCQWTRPSSNAMTTGKFGIKQMILSHLLFFSFRYCSTRHHYGDQFVGLFQRCHPGGAPEVL